MACLQSKQLIIGIMEVVTKHDSSLLVYNSADATLVDAVYGNGRFTCQMPNVNKGGSHAIKIVPSKIMIPNVFPNLVGGGMNVVQTYVIEVGGPVVASSVALPTGFYELTRLLTALNANVGGNFTFTFNANLGRVVVTSLVDADVGLELDNSLANILGFTGTGPFRSVSTPGRSFFTFMEAGDGALTAPSSPHCGCTPLVHVLARKAANGNLLSSNNSEYSVVGSVPMHAAAHGQYAVYTAPDIFLDDIDFRSPRHLGDVDFEIVDAQFKPLVIDPRFPVIIVLKVYHTDTRK